MKEYKCIQPNCDSDGTISAIYKGELQPEPCQYCDENKPKKMNRYKYIDEGRKHLHTLDSKPLIGTSTAMKIIGGKGGFSWYASGKALEEFGWINPKHNTEEDVIKALENGYEGVKGLDFEGYTKLIKKSYKEHDTYKKARGKIGTARHKELEKYIKNTMLCYENGMADKTLYSEEIKPFIDWAKEKVKKFLFSEIYCFSERLWLGGIADLGAEMKDGTKALGDFKSSKEVYADQFFQCGGYAIQIEENGGFTKDGDRVFEPMNFDSYFIVPFGADDITPVFVYDTQTIKEGAELAVGLYKKIEATNQLLNN